MKRIVGIVGMCVIALSATAVEKEIIKSSISEVTVYTQGAQVYRKANFNVKPGITELIIEGISPNIDPKSLQVKAMGNVVLIDSKYILFYPQPEPVKLDGLPLKIRKDISLVEDSISALEYDLRDIQDEIDVLVASKNILSNNGAVRGQGKVNDSIQLLKQTMEYYQLKMNELNKKMLVLNKRKADKERARLGMNRRLTDLKNYQSSNAPIVNLGPIHRIIITVQSKEIVAGKLSVSYVVSGASWVPMYDLRADITSGKVNLTYKAQVSQQTGEEWEDIRLTLSTNNPYQNKVKPTIHPWYVDYYVYKNINAYPSSAPAMQLEDMAKDRKSERNSAESYAEVDLINAQTSDQFTTMIDRVLSAEFRIDLPYTIKDNGEEHMVLVKNIDLNAEYKYFCVPKLDARAYLVAQIVKLDELQLVPATANIFFDGTYIGETYLDPTTMEDTLSLSLGVDPNIIVKRTLLKEKSKEKIVNTNKERTFAYEIEVKNLKSTSIDLVIQDQIPVTTNGDITIEPVDLDKARLDSVTGELTWEVTIKTKESKKFNFSYKVKYNKDMQVNL